MSTSKSKGAASAEYTSKTDFKITKKMLIIILIAEIFSEIVFEG